MLQNSVIEHNLLAASKIYQNIRFDQLGFLLGIKPAEVHNTTHSTRTLRYGERTLLSVRSRFSLCFVFVFILSPLLFVC